MEQKVWFITGASKGFGNILVKKLLEQGQLVAATSRNLSAFDDIKNDGFLGLEVKDLADEKQVINALHETKRRFNRIDVLVNNAGYGVIGAFEEVSDKDMRAVFDVNVFGTFNTIRNVLPIMREQNAGRIINISSIAGFVGVPYWSAYNATKFAVDGFTDALAPELSQFNIKVTSILPGPFNTDFLERDSKAVITTGNPAYAEGFNKENDTWDENNHKQTGDPYKAMDALIKIVEDDLNVEYIFFGEWAYSGANNRIEKWQKEMKDFEYLGRPLDYEK
ncbi:SDR family oxidoreductase [[Acholeplasma] multilocale]|uniref:SDR family oxidoreductase n=1 Tax=[Acholeplasma] multilocale TaxID=264638 RepID=UPI0004797383|nr:SDR family oxidoreductase [[Acholeplasma] multilocale]